MPYLFHLIGLLSELDTGAVADFSLPAIFVIIFFLTFLTEDGACLLAGALAAEGVVGYPFAILASFTGIFIGDIALYWLGRLSGERASKTKLFRRFVSESRLRQASHWLEERGLAAVFISRFIAGLRLPTYLAAGFLKTDFLKFTIYFFVAAVVWTPILVIGAGLAQRLLFSGNFLIGALILFILIKLLFIAFSRRRWRMFIGRLKRLYRWEFWPVQIFYIPVVAYVAYLGIRHRSLTVFTCANPAIPAGGFIGESKDEIYRGLARSPAAREHILAHKLIDPERGAEEAAAAAKEFVEHPDGGFPLILKPDAGERGKNVRIVRSQTELDEALAGIASPRILQQYAPGCEFSVFYYRHPSEPDGNIFSATEKVFPTVTGDGRSTIEELILEDPRAVSIARVYFENLEDDAGRVPAEGEAVRLVEIGTHARGAIFNDGSRIISEALREKIDEICKGYDGFYFGRFDLRAASEEKLKKGERFLIVELNGVTSESTNIYDRKYSLFQAWGILCEQWRLAFAIGSENRERGARQYTVRELVRMLSGRHKPGKHAPAPEGV